MGRRDVEEKPGQGPNERKHSKEVKYPSGADACFAAVARFTHASTKLRSPQDNLLNRRDDQSTLVLWVIEWIKFAYVIKSIYNSPTLSDLLSLPNKVKRGLSSPFKYEPDRLLSRSTAPRNDELRSSSFVIASIWHACSSYTVKQAHINCNPSICTSHPPPCRHTSACRIPYIHQEAQSDTVITGTSVPRSICWQELWLRMARRRSCGARARRGSQELEEGWGWCHR
jgi:hypothetical protein